MSREQIQTLSIWSAYTLSLLFFIAYVFFAYPLTSPFPYADDWSYVFRLLNEHPYDVRWLSEPHNEHFIPLVKFLQLLTLDFAGGDFKALLLANSMICFFIACIWISCIRRYGGPCSSILVFIPPLVLQSAGLNAQYWGFMGQFLLSVMFMSLAARSHILAMNGSGRWGRTFAFLTLAAFCGLSGAIPSMIAGAILCLALFKFRGKVIYSRCWTLLAVLTWLCVVIFQASLIFASSETASSPTLGTLVIFLLNISKSWVGVSAVPMPTVSAIAGGLMTAFLLITILSNWYCARQALRTPIPYVWSFWVHPGFVMLCATFGTLFAVAYGRSAVQPWWPGLELHYGVLAGLLPFAACLLGSSARFQRNVLMPQAMCYVLVAVCVASFIGGWTWRYPVLKAQHARVLELAAQVSGSDAVFDDPKKYQGLLFWENQVLADNAAPYFSALRSLPKWQQHKAN